MKKYCNPEIELLIAENTDIITTSDILSGVETTPVPDNSGSWETL